VSHICGIVCVLTRCATQIWDSGEEGERDVGEMYIHSAKTLILLNVLGFMYARTRPRSRQGVCVNV
jgi:hypothetical protein